MMVNELREQLRALNADIVFIKESPGPEHSKHATRSTTGPLPIKHTTRTSPICASSGTDFCTAPSMSLSWARRCTASSVFVCRSLPVRDGAGWTPCTVTWKYITEPDSPLIIAGDFNDWHNKADALLAQRLGLGDGVSKSWRHQLIRTQLPVQASPLPPGPHYVRDFSAAHAEVRSGAPWSKKYPTMARSWQGCCTTNAKRPLF